LLTHPPTEKRDVLLLENRIEFGHSSSRLITITAAATAGLTLSGWILGKSSTNHGIALAAGGAALSLILVSLVGGIIYQGAAARVRADDALRQSEERFRLFVERVHDYAIILFDREGAVVSWNAGAERAKGYKTEEIIGDRSPCSTRPRTW
jgi:PAS domain-containing protein